jgi:hypothetical protein
VIFTIFEVHLYARYLSLLVVVYKILCLVIRFGGVASYIELTDVLSI